MPESPEKHTAIEWFVYMVLCSDNSLYTGITTDIERRFRQHGEGAGAKYFRGRKPLQVVYLERGHSRSTASIREARIKKMNRAEKASMVQYYAVGKSGIPADYLC